jgi:hypothetical protein
MSSQSPQVGQISPDGMFQWDGRDWQPLARAYREPTSWTRPLQLATAAYLVLAVIESVLSTALFLNSAAIARATQASSPGLSDDQVRQAASLALTLGWASVIVFSLVMLFLAVASYLGWRWVFWVDLVWLALSSIGVVTGLISLSNSAVQSMPVPAIVVSFLFSLAALALLVWFIIAATRFGPWAMRKPR